MRACQAEFHRRLRFFNGWRLKSAPSTPRELGMATSTSLAPSLLQKPIDHKQRYFRAPLALRKHRESGTASAEKGYWFCHFDGEFIVREIELRPRVTTIVYVAGMFSLFLI